MVRHHHCSRSLWPVLSVENWIGCVQGRTKLEDLALDGDLLTCLSRLQKSWNRKSLPCHVSRCWGVCWPCNPNILFPTLGIAQHTFKGVLDSVTKGALNVYHVLGSVSAYRGREKKDRTSEIPKAEMDPSGMSHHF